jgi:hypothetical protein
MAKYYKVWAYLEEIDESENHYEDIGSPLSIGEFKTPEEAETFREMLHGFRVVLNEEPEIENDRTNS